MSGRDWISHIKSESNLAVICLIDGSLTVDDIRAVDGDPRCASIGLTLVMQKVIDIAHAGYSQVCLELNVERAQAQTPRWPRGLVQHDHICGKGPCKVAIRDLHFQNLKIPLIRQVSKMLTKFFRP